MPRLVSGQDPISLHARSDASAPGPVGFRKAAATRPILSTVRLHHPTVSRSSPLSTASPKRRSSRVSLFSQVLGVNTAIIVATVFVATVAAQIDITTSDGLNGFLIAIAAMLATALVNGWVLRRRFRPLEQLIGALDNVDLERPNLALTAGRREPADVEQLRHGVEGMLARLDQERRYRASAVIDAQESERARLARDLHDEVNQSLTGIMLRLSAIAADADPQTQRALQEVRDLTEQAMGELLRLSHDLRPMTLDDLGLSAALAARLKQLRRDTNLIVRGDVAPDLPSLSREQQTVLFRIAQEAISNVVQHANATTIVVVLRPYIDGRVMLRVSDDGRGIEPSRPTLAGERTSSGLTGMRERALLVGGTLDLRSSHTGTTVELVL